MERSLKLGAKTKEEYYRRGRLGLCVTCGGGRGESVLRSCSRCLDQKRAATVRYTERHPDRKLTQNRRAYWNSVAKNPSENRNRQLRHRYGITSRDFDLLLIAQGGGCAICGRLQGKNARGRELMAVDHCHTTGVVRGILCAKCNGGLAAFGDCDMNIESALKYLRRPHNDARLAKSS